MALLWGFIFKLNHGNLTIRGFYSNLPILKITDFFLKSRIFVKKLLKSWNLGQITLFWPVFRQKSALFGQNQLVFRLFRLFSSNVGLFSSNQRPLSCMQVQYVQLMAVHYVVVVKYQKNAVPLFLFLILLGSRYLIIAAKLPTHT